MSKPKPKKSTVAPNEIAGEKAPLLQGSLFEEDSHQSPPESKKTSGGKTPRRGKIKLPAEPEAGSIAALQNPGSPALPPPIADEVLPPPRLPPPKPAQTVPKSKPLSRKRAVAATGGARKGRGAGGLPGKRKGWLAEKQELIDDWRGVETGADLLRNPPSLSRLLEDFLKESGLAQRVCEEEILSAWTPLVGRYLGEHTRPLALQRGVLTIAVAQPAVHHTLRGMKPDLLNTLKARFPQIKDLRFRIS